MYLNNLIVGILVSNIGTSIPEFFRLNFTLFRHKKKRSDKVKVRSNIIFNHLFKFHGYFIMYY